MKFEEIVNAMKETLKGMLTAENTEVIASVDKQIDQLSDEHNQTLKSLQDTKDKLVDYVKSTGFQKPTGQNDVQPDEALSLDDAIMKGLEKIQNDKK